MLFNLLLHVITKIINIESIKVLNYDFMDDNEIVIQI